MRIGNYLFQNIRTALTLLGIVFQIQTRKPTQEESDILVNGFRELDVSPAVYQENALLALQLVIKRYIEDLEASFYELSRLHGLVPKSLHSVLGELIEGIKKTNSDDLVEYFDEGLLKEHSIRSLFTPTPEDELVISEHYETLKSLYNETVTNLLDELEDTIDPSILPIIEDGVRDLNLIEFILQYFELSNYDNVSEEEMKYSQVKAKLDEIETAVISGAEEFKTLINDSPVSGMEAGFVDTVKAGIAKVVDTIKTALKTLLDFFAGRKKDAATQIADIKEKFNKQIEDLKAAGNDKLEIDQENIKKTIDMLEKADLSEVANHFKGVNDATGAISAYTAALSDLEKLCKPDDADKQLGDTQSKLNELSGTQVNVNNDAPTEEKSTLKEVVSERTKALQEKFAEAKESVKNFIKPLSAMERLNSTLGKVIKKKSEKEEKVSGNEAWME